MKKLIVARDEANIPFIITSAYRCADYNRSIGGAESSAHTYGRGVDIAAGSSRHRYTILKALMRAGFTRFGVYDKHIHVDDMDTLSHPSHPADVMWVGRSK